MNQRPETVGRRRAIDKLGAYYCGERALTFDAGTLGIFCGELIEALGLTAVRQLGIGSTTLCRKLKEGESTVGP